MSRPASQVDWAGPSIATSTGIPRDTEEISATMSTMSPPAYFQGSAPIRDVRQSLICISSVRTSPASAFHFG